jgi:hypothetical protein
MKMPARFAMLAAVLLLAPATAAAAATVTGDYLEARTADVYTGPCFANGEMNLAGMEATLAWRIREGGWEGVRLDGLAVVAVVKAQATLGHPHADPRPIRSELLVDARGTTEQQRALEAMGRALGGEVLGTVTGVRAVPIEVALDGATARLAAGELAEIRTRPIGHGDHLCGNEEVFYTPLTAVEGAAPAYALVNEYRGDAFGVKWASNGKRSAFVARFAR